MATKPTKTVLLKTKLNLNGRTELSRTQLLIEVDDLPEWAGAYVVRYATHFINRHTSSSPILKIGEAAKGIRYRFENYNHQTTVTIDTRNVVDIMLERSQTTNVRLMHYISHNTIKSDIYIDCYALNPGQTAKQLEFALLREYFDAHNELPPLNFGFK